MSSALQPPDVENAACAVTVRIAFRKSDFSVHHNRTVPVTGATFEVRDLTSVIWLVDTKGAALVVNVKHSSRYNGARAVIVVAPNTLQLAISEIPRRRALVIG